MERLPIFAVIFWLCFSFGPAAQTAQNEARVGVLAYRGSDLLQDNWKSLRDYLNASIPEWNFIIVRCHLAFDAKCIRQALSGFTSERKCLTRVVRNWGRYRQ